MNLIQVIQSSNTSLLNPPFFSTQALENNSLFLLTPSIHFSSLLKPSRTYISSQPNTSYTHTLAHKASSHTFITNTDTTPTPTCIPTPTFLTTSPHYTNNHQVIKRIANILRYTQFFYSPILAKAPLRVFTLHSQKMISPKERKTKTKTKISLTFVAQEPSFTRI